MSYMALIASALYSGIKARQTANANANIADQERLNAVDQANSQTNLVVRQGRENLGKEISAFGASGVGTSGTAAGALQETSLNSEMDALNTRYKGILTGWGYGVESQMDRTAAANAIPNAFMTAGARYLSGGYGSGYTGGN